MTPATRSPLFWVGVALGILGLAPCAMAFSPWPDPRSIHDPTASEGYAIAEGFAPLVRSAGLTLFLAGAAVAWRQHRIRARRP